MRPTGLELAEIFRQVGHEYRRDHAGSLNRAQLRAMSAIERCRTAALGGHVEQCDACGHQRIAFNSCLMGSVPLWGVQAMKRREGWFSRVCDSPLRL